jgi:hypothetical protein
METTAFETNMPLHSTYLLETIILKPDAKPKYQSPYRLSPDKKEVLRHHQGIICTIDPSEDLPITSPVVLVTKRAKSTSEGPPYGHEDSISHFRFGCDFRYLNSMTQNFNYVIPDLQELTESFTERTPNFITVLLECLNTQERHPSNISMI